jgi:hypothetical protein
MTATPKFLIAAVAALALATAALVTEAAARGQHGGGHGGGQGRHHLAGQPRTGHHHGHHLHLQRHRHQRQFFSRFTPCVVWTRQGWTNVCGKAPLIGSAPQ